MKHKKLIIINVIFFLLGLGLFYLYKNNILRGIPHFVMSISLLLTVTIVQYFTFKTFYSIKWYHYSYLTGKALVGSYVLLSFYHFI